MRKKKVELKDHSITFTPFELAYITAMVGNTNNSCDSRASDLYYKLEKINGAIGAPLGDHIDDNQYIDAADHHIGSETPLEKLLQSNGFEKSIDCYLCELNNNIISVKANGTNVKLVPVDGGDETELNIVFKTDSDIKNLVKLFKGTK